MTKQNIKITCYVAIFLFLFLQFLNVKPTTAASYAVSLAALFDLAYDRILWRYNPFEKTPHLYGTYEEENNSTYKGGHYYKAKAIIRQTLSHITIHEEVKDSGYAESITAALIKPASADGVWKLYYTYVTHPAVGTTDDMHEGTVVLRVKDEKTLEGIYFTNRTVPTKGDTRLVKKTTKTK